MLSSKQIWVCRGLIAPLALWLVLVMRSGDVTAQGDNTHQHHGSAAANTDSQTSVGGLKIPDIELVDQNRKRVNFYSDLVKGNVVAINTIFTTCTTICPIMGANFAELGRLLDSSSGVRIKLISISIDPVVDTPERLRQWSARFGQPAQNWTLLTGNKAEVDRLLKALQVFTSDKQDHSPIVLIGGDGAESWVRASALLTPSHLADLIRERSGVRRAASAPRLSLIAQQVPGSREDQLSAAALQYFTDVRLITQNGDSVRLYSDLLKAKVVVINAFFATCTDVCPVISGILASLQDRLGEHLGKDVFFLSFSVDPEFDTAEKLKKYAERFHAKPGWLFLTGQKENVDFALSRLGQKVARKEDHLSIFMIGNNKTGLWTKVLAPTSNADSLKIVVEKVLNDKG